MPAPLVIVSPLNWGLGHATRCIPVIRGLLDRGMRVHLVAEGGGAAILGTTFPGIPVTAFPGYEIHYPEEGRSFSLSMVRAAPGILRGIKKEHECLLDLCEKTQASAVISDNRFGLWHPRLRTVFITHQVQIKAPVGETLIGMMNKKYIRKFNECWIPDDEVDGLSGVLGHSFRGSLNARYIGTLSRFTKGNNDKRKDIDLLLLLSGPEPQRSIFERILCENVQKLKSIKKDLKTVLVRGLPTGELPALTFPGPCFNHLNDLELQDHINRSLLVLSRPGYSTLMDLDRIGAKAAFIPTPGQTEQEYLGKSMMERSIALCLKQGRIDLDYALETLGDYSGFPGRNASGGMDLALDDLCGLLQGDCKN